MRSHNTPNKVAACRRNSYEVKIFDRNSQYPKGLPHFLIDTKTVPASSESFGSLFYKIGSQTMLLKCHSDSFVTFSPHNLPLFTQNDILIVMSVRDSQFARVIPPKTKTVILPISFRKYSRRVTISLA